MSRLYHYRVSRDVNVVRTTVWDVVSDHVGHGRHIPHSQTNEYGGSKMAGYR
jgi:hypothetical protein